MAKPWRAIRRKGSPEREIDTVLQAAAVLEPNAGITQSELMSYLAEYAQDGPNAARDRLAELDRAALKIIGANAL